MDIIKNENNIENASEISEKIEKIVEKFKDRKIIADYLNS